MTSHHGISVYSILPHPGVANLSLATLVRTTGTNLVSVPVSKKNFYLKFLAGGVFFLSTTVLLRLFDFEVEIFVSYSTCKKV